MLKISLLSKQVRIENVGKFLPRSSGQCISQSEHLFLQSPVIEDRTITFTVMCSKTVTYTKRDKNIWVMLCIIICILCMSIQIYKTRAFTITKYIFPDKYGFTICKLRLTTSSEPTGFLSESAKSRILGVNYIHVLLNR